ncbi:MULTISPECIES: winged helix-turn-helix domain-containing protein [Hungatella]|uniref:Winged helix-turn-helix domain-containing protein n=1 Tax=Hungatella hathewayi TaxID=154046 RepID=A0AAW9WH19_9FIRM|nr:MULTISPECIES: crosslink repair DNA glycosylase YcaQ family protein [Hungatella]MCQ4829687.1 winged helix DNA-binding domain-containing protein [Hungatella sp. SL.1.14]MUB64620.1 winged helix-turn-helix domain-containing protein [Hungatella hathewayi]CUQ09169.1 Uncharacterized protein conserved in bacteria [Hungatella hathewayi]
MIKLTNRQAREFLLSRQGLIGDYIFTGKQGVLDFIHQAGCIQYDPIDICGKNADLVCQSRIKDFNKDILYELLYSDRILIDYPDKNLSIILTEDWPYFARYRIAAQFNAARYPEMEPLMKTTVSFIEKNGAICSKDLKFEGNISWESSIHWSNSNNMSRAVLEQLYSMGTLIIHHKDGNRKYYDLASKYINHEFLNIKDPFDDEFKHQKWRMLRRIRSIGLLWNRSSDAWLNIGGLNSHIRNNIFRQLLEENVIAEVLVDGIKDILYCCVDELNLLNSISHGKELNRRCEFIAPLDNLLWDRKLIQAIFNFDYKWEIYIPAAIRKFGYYVLPIIYGNNFIGRIELIVDKKRKILNFNNIWYEAGISHSSSILKEYFNEALLKFAFFNECKSIRTFPI